MYFLVHLLTGIIIGIILSLICRDTRVIPVTMLGSIVPDLIDKPIGILFTGYSRSYAHTLLFAGLIVLIGLWVYLLNRRTFFFIQGFILGIFSHHILDEMWLWPMHWYWPAFGPFIWTLQPKFVGYAFWNEVTNPIEWLAGILILTFLFIFFIPRYRKNDTTEQSKPSTNNSQDLPEISKKISLVIPTMNESENIPYVFSKIPPIVDEIIVVDSSQDDTIEVIKKISPNAIIIKTNANGKGNALKIGFQNASGDIIVMMDADGSMNPNEIPNYIKPLYNGCDVVQGSRILGGSEDLTLFRRFGNFIFVSLVNKIFRCKYSDMCYGYRAFKKEVIDKIDLDSFGFDIETELTIKTRKNGFKICEISSFEGKRIHGTSNLKAFRDGLKILFRIFKEWYT